MAKKTIPPISGLWRGFFAIFLVDEFVFASSKITNDKLQNRGISPLKISLIATLASFPFAAFGEGMMANRQVHGLSYRSAIPRALSPGGFILTFFRDGPYNAALFAFDHAAEDERHSFLREIASGVVGGGAAGLITAPIDKVKTIVQTEGARTSIRKVTSKILKEQGWRGLFEGGKARCVYISACVATQKLFYSYAQPLLPKSLHLPPGKPGP